MAEPMTPEALEAIRARLAAARRNADGLWALQANGQDIADIATLLAEVERLEAGRQRLRSALLHQAAAMARRDTVANEHDLGLISRAAHLRTRPALERADAAAMDLHRAAMRALEDDNA